MDADQRRDEGGDDGVTRHGPMDDLVGVFMAGVAVLLALGLAALLWVG